MTCRRSSRRSITESSVACATILPFKPDAGRILIGPPSAGMNGLMEVVYYPPPDSHPLRSKHYIGSYLSRGEAIAVARIYAPKLEFIFGEEVFVHVEGRA